MGPCLAGGSQEEFKNLSGKPDAHSHTGTGTFQFEMTAPLMILFDTDTDWNNLIRHDGNTKVHGNQYLLMFHSKPQIWK